MTRRTKKTSPGNSSDVSLPFDEAAVEAILKMSPPLPEGVVTIHVPEAGAGTLVPQQLPRRQALHYSLNRAARLWESYSKHVPYETDHRVAKEAKRATSAAKRLLAVFEVSESSSVIRPDGLASWTRDLPPLPLASHKEDPAIVDRPGELARVLDGIRGLRDWAVEIEEKAVKFGPTLRSERHEPDYARDALLKALLRIWRDIFEQPIGTSTFSQHAPPDQRGRATGPLVKFLKACLRPIDGVPKLSADTIRDRVTCLKPELTVDPSD